MHPRKRFALPVVLVLVTLISVTVQVQQSSYAAAAKLVEDARARLGAPGVSVAIAAHDRLVYSTGFGLADVENQVPASATTVNETPASAASDKTCTSLMRTSLAILLIDCYAGGPASDRRAGAANRSTLCDP